jgi:hypothetical protein
VNFGSGRSGIFQAKIFDHFVKSFSNIAMHLTR